MRWGDFSDWKQERKKKNLLFKPELGQFVLWLSRQRSALNPYEDSAAEGPKKNTKSRSDDENMPSQQVEVEMGGLGGVVGPPVRDVSDTWFF